MSDNIFDTSVTFSDLGLSKDVLRGITEQGFTHPTDIQARLIPTALQGHDALGQAKTGTGKTAAFALPILNLAEKDTPMQALILVPTRELAVQVAGEIQALGQYTSIKSTCIIGGESMQRQTRSIESGGHIIVGTPGRIMDMQNRKLIHFDNIRFLVLDEVDRMLDIGFRQDIRKIFGLVKTAHQTLFVSATIEKEIEKLAKQYLKPDFQKITTTSGALTVSLVDQLYFPVERWDKRSLLLHLLRHEKPSAAVVFCRTKATVHRITTYLREKKIKVHEIHGDMAQNKRNKVMQQMRDGQLDVMIASDLAARGLDIAHLSHVINYDLPEDIDLYVHRIGRTARAGKRGIAWSFVTPDQGQLLTDIEKLTGALIERQEYPKFKPGPVPRDVLEERQAEEVRLSGKKVVDRTAATATDQYSKAQLAQMFPGGNIPKNLPPRGIGSKLRSKRRR